jgi:hypothetical protein
MWDGAGQSGIIGIITATGEADESMSLQPAVEHRRPAFLRNGKHRRRFKGLERKAKDLRASM